MKANWFCCAKLGHPNVTLCWQTGATFADKSVRATLGIQSCSPVHQQRERATSSPRRAQAVDQKTSVRRYVVTGGKTQGLTASRADQDFGFSGMDGTITR